jgi:putative lipoic acid-binding regulatory protein
MKKACVSITAHRLDGTVTLQTYEELHFPASFELVIGEHEKKIRDKIHQKIKARSSGKKHQNII